MLTFMGFFWVFLGRQINNFGIHVFLPILIHNDNFLGYFDKFLLLLRLSKLLWKTILTFISLKDSQEQIIMKKDPNVELLNSFWPSYKVKASLYKSILGLNFV